MTGMRSGTLEVTGKEPNLKARQPRKTKAPQTRPELRPGAVSVFQRFLLGQTFCCAQIGLGSLVATSTPNTVAVVRTFPAIVMSASAKGGC